MLLELNDKFELGNGDTALFFHLPGHCAGCAKVLEMLEDRGADNWTIYKVDAEDDKFADLIKEYEVTTAPTIVTFKDKVQIDKIVGLKDFLDKRKIFID